MMKNTLDNFTNNFAKNFNKNSETLSIFSPTVLPAVCPTCHLDDDGEQEQGDEVLLAEPDTELDEPQRFAVVLYNDDYTPMDFVVEVLQEQFQMSVDKAVEVMLAVHHDGRGVAGVYSRDIAETKSHAVNETARQAGYPLLTLAEPY